MKTKLLKLSCIAVLFFTFFGCCKDCEKKLAKAKIELKKCQAHDPDVTALCSSEDRLPNPNDNDSEDLFLKFNCSNQKVFQHLHIDLVNQFGILGKIAFDKNGTTPNKVDLKLKEVGNCNRFQLDSIVYAGSKDNIENINQKIHYLRAWVSEYTGDENERPKIRASLNKAELIDPENGEQLNIKLGDLFDIHIENPIIQPNKFVADGDISTKTKYDEQFCLTEATDL